MREKLWVTVAVVCWLAAPLAAQSSLEEAVELSRRAWMKHDVEALVAKSDTIRLHLPGVATSASAKPGQASRLLGQYLARAAETAFALREVRRLAPDHAYAEMIRTFKVRGTSEERSETVFLGFRILEGEWRLREVRVTP